MRRKQEPKQWAEQHLKDIRWATQKRYSAEERILIVLEGLRGEESIAKLCRKEGIAQGLYYTDRKGFLRPCKVEDSARHLLYVTITVL